jgi:hypothetical protein
LAARHCSFGSRLPPAFASGGIGIAVIVSDVLKYFALPTHRPATALERRDCHLTRYATFSMTVDLPENIRSGTAIRLMNS